MLRVKVLLISFLNFRTRDKNLNCTLTPVASEAYALNYVTVKLSRNNYLYENSSIG